jgi:hypothetical protein
VAILKRRTHPIAKAFCGNLVVGKVVSRRWSPRIAYSKSFYPRDQMAGRRESLRNNLVKKPVLVIKLSCDEAAKMKISTDDAAAIYARMCHARYGRRAPHVVKDKIRELQKRGDASGSTPGQRLPASWQKSKPIRTGAERRNVAPRSAAPT